MTASWKRVLEDRGFSARKSGTRLYLMNGMSRDEIQKLGGWETPGVMDTVYRKAASEEVVLEMRSASNKASTFLGAHAFVVTARRLLVPGKGPPFVCGFTVFARWRNIWSRQLRPQCLATI